MELNDYKQQYSGPIFICGNGASMNLLTAKQKTALKARSTFAGSRWVIWEEGWTPDFYILTERKQTNEWLQRGFNKAQAKVARFFVDWHPTPNDWVTVPRPPSNAHDVLNYGMGGLLGSCEQNADLGIHLHYGKDTPLAMIQVARYMGFGTFYLLGCETTRSGHSYDANEGRPMHADGIMDAYYERAAKECSVYDCTPGGRLTQQAILKAVELEDALAG